MEVKAMIKKGIYQHFKGNYYELIDFAIDSETLEEMIIYQALYGEKKLWVRPLKMWDELVEYNGEKVRRFKFIKEVE